MILGISAFRLQSDGSPLPNARNLTLRIFKDTSRTCDHENNELLVPWAQFITHDVAYSPVRSINSSFPGKIIDTRIYEQIKLIFDVLTTLVCILFYTAALEHCHDKNPPVECKATIPISPDDPVYGKLNMTILKFMRLVTSSADNCSLVPDTVVSIYYYYYY